MAVIDWMCEGVGLMCRECTLAHVCDGTTRHRADAHECCIACGLVDRNNLNPLAGTVRLGGDADDLQWGAELLRGGQRCSPLARGTIGELVTTPVAWECPAHDGFLDSDITIHWPSLPVPPVEKHVIKIGAKPKGGPSTKSKKRKRR